MSDQVVLRKLNETNNVKRQFLFLDARQTNFIGEFDPGSG